LEALFLPGMDGTAQLYHRLMQALPPAWRKSAIPYPGNARVPYEKLLRMVQANASEEPFLLIAESYSTPLAISYAATRPKNLKALVLCGGFASSPVSGLRWLAAQLLRPFLFHLPLTDRTIERYLLDENADPALKAELRAALATVKPSVLAARLGEILSCDVRADLTRIDVPSLYIQAENDCLVSPNSLAEILLHKPDLIVASIPGPHLLFQREPARTAKAIEDFVHQLGLSEFQP